MTKPSLYRTQGTCSQFIEVTLDDNERIEEVKFIGGCNGNLQGVSALVRGMDAHNAISRLNGIRCGSKNTSCPDQLCRALEQALNAAKTDNK